MFKRINPISKLIALVAASIVMLAGVAPSIILDNWEWFGRSGSLLTAYGVTVAYLDVAGFLDSVSENTIERMDQVIESADTSGYTKEEIEQKKKEILKSMRKSVLRVEFLVLVVGTLIWGYGDKLFK